MKRIFGLIAVVATLALGMNVLAGAFTPGNIVILHVSDGSQILTNTGNTVYLDEYTTNGTLVQSFPMPTTWVGNQAPLIMSGVATLQGALTRSADGRFLVLTGYGATLGQFTNTSLSSTTTTGNVNQVPRVVGLVDGNGHIYTSILQTNVNETGEEPRCAVSLDGTNVWLAGDTTGAKYLTGGRTSMVSTQVGANANTRFINIWPSSTSNTLYYSANHVLGAPTNTSGAVNPFGGSLPTSFVQSNFLLLPGVYNNSITNSLANGSPNGFAMFNLANQHAGGALPDTLYVADNVTNAPGEPNGKAGGLLKYCYIPASNAWVNFGYIYADQAYFVTGIQNGTNVSLYITGGGTFTSFTLNNLYPYKDVSGFAGSPEDSPDGGDANQYKIFLSPGGNTGSENTRGIALAPVGGDAGTITASAGTISVGPPYGPYFYGPQGGPFKSTPSNFVFSVANMSSTSNANFNIVNPIAWVDVTPMSGSISAGGSTTVSVSPNANANTLLGGSVYSGKIQIHLGVAGGPVVAAPVIYLSSLAFSVSPSSNYTAVGSAGGPFSPPSYVYAISNQTPNSLNWVAGLVNGSTWATVTPTTGSVAGSSASNITVTINGTANSLPLGLYTDTIVFSNASANTQIDTHYLDLQVGFGFFDDFSTYTNGNIVGQDNWFNPTSGFNDDPYQIVNGVLVLPGGPGALCPGDSTLEEPAKAVAASAVTNAGAVMYLGMSMTVTSALPTPATWDFAFLQTTFAGASTPVTSNKGRTSVADAGGGHYKWYTHNNGFNSFVPGTTTRNYNQQYNVFIVGEVANSNCWVFVDPPSSDTNWLVTANADAHDGPDVAGWGGPSSGGIGAVDIDHFCSSSTQAGYLITKIAMSTNYTDVYNFLHQVATPPPTASFTAAPTSGAAPLTVNFTDTSSGSPTAWYWTFDGVNTSASQNPSFTYTTPGSYTAQLIASNAGGASSPVTQTISVYDPYAWWRLFYYGDTNSASGSPGADPYGTGMSNTNKFLAGFSTNSAAYLHIISVAKTNGSDVKVTFLGANGDSSYTPGIASRTNRLEFTTGTANGSYTNSFSQVPGVSDINLSTGTGVGVITNFTDVGGATNKPSRYYRVRVLLP